MTIYIALFRGINVGGHNIIKMAELKRLFETMGLGNVQTYIQSGNVLFESKKADTALRNQIEHEVEKVFGFAVTVILRSALELEEIIKKCPFSVENLAEGESVHVAFLAKTPSQEGIDLLNSFESKIDEYQLTEKEVYLYFHQSIRNSKLAIQLQKLGVPATVRNWKTTTKLDAMAKEMV
jgi:uncharacterized protein (DUF1697 family)